MTPSAVPSLGAAENRKLAARKLPLPGMDWATTVGSPGMYRPMKARDQAAVVVIGAAGTEADVEIDGLALEELIGALRRRRLRQQGDDAATAAGRAQIWTRPAVIVWFRYG